MFTIQEAVLRTKKEGFEPLRKELEARVQAVDAKVGAYLNTQSLTSTPEPLRSAPFYGLPVSLKDNICVKDWETTCSSEMLLGHIPPYDATVVEKLKKNGAYIFQIGRAHV